MCTVFDQIIPPGAVLVLSKAINDKEKHKILARVVRQKSLLIFLKNQ